jgi:predicted metal-dependent HD superfamily phosphohydrolase
VLHRLDLLAGETPHPGLVRMAAWFHDAVYDPTTTDNEERSAELATTTLARLGLEPGLVAEVARLVRVTATHDVPEGDRDAAVLCDADLAVLASDPLRYQSYVDGVRREYQHLDDATFATGRSDVLSRLLDRPQLFRTAYGRRVWEEAARANASAELRSLQQS